MFHVCETAPPLAVALESLTVPLSHARVTVWGPLCKALPCLRLGSWRIITLSPTLYVCAMRLAFSRLLFWNLDDKSLLSFLNVLPVGLERYVEDGVAVEHQLRWRSSGRSVHC